MRSIITGVYAAIERIAGGALRPRSSADQIPETEQCHDAAARTPVLLVAVHPAAAQAARQCAHDRLVGGQHRGMGNHPPDGTAVVAAAHGPDANSRHAELDLVRVRHAGRLLAPAAGSAERRRHADHVDQRQGLRDLPGSRGRGAGCRLGIHGARLCADADPADRGPARRHQTIRRADRDVYRQAADRMAWSRPRPDLRHTGLRHRMRTDLVRRLDPRRSAAVGEDRARPNPRGALQRQDRRHHA